MLLNLDVLLICELLLLDKLFIGRFEIEELCIDVILLFFGVWVFVKLLYANNLVDELLSR